MKGNGVCGNAQTGLGDFPHHDQRTLQQTNILLFTELGIP